jgi:hypothetical protein
MSFICIIEHVLCNSLTIKFFSAMQLVGCIMKLSKKHGCHADSQSPQQMCRLAIQVSYLGELCMQCETIK